jgi:hypothetical protein
MPDQKVPDHQADKPVVRTGGQVFSDGSVLELIQGPNCELNLLSWDGKSAKMAAQFVRGDETFVPLRVDPAILRSMRLPSNVAKYGSTRKLFTEISGLISQTAQAGDGVVLPLTFCVFATWLCDSLPVAPFVWIVTPPTTTAAPLGQLLSLLCRRAFVVSDVSSAGFHSLPMDLQPTLLTEIFQPTRRALNLLRASTRHGAFVAAGGKTMDAFCAKIVFAPEPLRDPASAGFPLELVLPPTREYVPPISASEAERIATEYQAKLLRYRLLNRAKVRAPSFDMNQFTVPMQELAYSLAASIADDDELQSEIVSFLKPLDREIRVDRASLLEAIVLEVLLARCHSTNDKDFPVAERRGCFFPTMCAKESTIWLHAMKSARYANFPRNLTARFAQRWRCRRMQRRILRADRELPERDFEFCWGFDIPEGVEVIEELRFFSWRAYEKSES